MTKGEIQLFLSALKDVEKKVYPSIINSIDDHRDNDDFDVQKDSLDFLDVSV